MLKQRRYAAALWCNQVDAAANGEAEAKLDGGARVQRRHEEEEEAKRRREKRK